MPLSKKKGMSGNISELMRKYHKTGTIGNIIPKNKKHAIKIATAIAYRTKRGE